MRPRANTARPRPNTGSPGRRGTAAPRLLVVSQFFPPEVGAPQARLGEMTRLWSRAGMEVTVLTGFPNYPTGVVSPEYQGAIRRVERYGSAGDGMTVIRTWLRAASDSTRGKTLSHLSFAVSSLLLGARVTGPADVVLVSSGPFFQVASAWLLARLKRARFVVEIRDLWPAVFVDLGVVTDRRLIWLLERFELAAYRAADLVVPVTEGFRDDLVRRGVPADKIEVVPNGVDTTAFVPRAASAATRRRLGAADSDCLVLYLGTHGISQGLTTVVEAAHLVADEPVHFAFVGEGAEKNRLRERVAELGLTNVTMLPGVPRREVPDVIAAADVCLVPLRDIALFSTFVPSKMFELLAAGKAVVGSVRGEAASILVAAGATVVPPEDPVALAAAVRAFAGDPAGRRMAGRTGREQVVARFDRATLAERYRTLLVGLLPSTSTGASTGPGTEPGPGRTGRPRRPWPHLVNAADDRSPAFGEAPGPAVVPPRAESDAPAALGPLVPP